MTGSQPGTDLPVRKGVSQSPGTLPHPPPLPPQLTGSLWGGSCWAGEADRYPACHSRQTGLWHHASRHCPTPTAAASPACHTPHTVRSELSCSPRREQGLVAEGSLQLLASSPPGSGLVWRGQEAAFLTPALHRQRCLKGICSQRPHDRPARQTECYASRRIGHGQQRPAQGRNLTSPFKSNHC